MYLINIRRWRTIPHGSASSRSSFSKKESKEFPVWHVQIPDDVGEIAIE
jgi:hypothetical protein